MPHQIASMAQNNEKEFVIKISFSYDVEMLHKIRTLPGRRWHKEQKVWSAPLYIESIEQLQVWGFEIDDKLQKFLQNTEIAKSDIITDGIAGLKETPFNFQYEGIAFIDIKKGSAIIGDEMGLGKTVQALGWLQHHSEKRPAIIVVPASLKLNWQREANKWMTNPKCQILSGTTANEKITGELIIINYDILFAWIDKLKAVKPSVLILDEVHYIKNNATKRTKAVKKLARIIPNIIPLSGTMIENRPIEIYNAWKLVDPINCPDRWFFLHRYCGAKHNGFGWDFTGHSHIPELHRLLKTVMIRRLKKDVMPELPDKMYSIIPFELHNKTEYKEAEKDFIEYLKRTKGQEAADKSAGSSTLASIEGLKQLAVKGKLTQAIEWIEEFLNVENKLVVFCTHKFVIDELMEVFKTRAVKIDGSVTLPDRQRSVDIFQHNPKVNLFIGNIKAAGVGITLTAASNVVFLEYPWAPGELNQAIDRVHRIGQKDSVNVYYLMAQNTIEEKIVNLLDKKRKILDAVLDGKETESKSLFSELMKEYY